MLEALQKFFDVFGATIVVPVMIFIESQSQARFFQCPARGGWFDRIWLGHLCFYTAGNQVHPANG